MAAVADRGCDARRLGAWCAELIGDRAEDERAFVHRSERKEQRCAVRLIGEQPSELDREACLPGATRPDDRQHARCVCDPRRDGVIELTLTTEKPRRRGRELDAPGSAQGRERATPELEETCCSVEILEPVSAEILEVLSVEQGSCRG
ncbi:MAG: hypothetical protein ACR2GV_00895 [Gaiellaceae bacterium]